uniref:F-box domain-containing protein n=1 Tax=viral metagenome TaxID=1070528 RepID=A0A6C0EHZ8_9ZZZZ
MTMNTLSTTAPPEIVGTIMSYLAPKDILKWIVLSVVSQNEVLFKELKRVYMTNIQRYSPTNYGLYHIYFNLNNINTHKKYMDKLSEFHEIAYQNQLDRPKSLILRDELSSKIVDKRQQTKFLNLTKYIWKVSL